MKYDNRDRDREWDKKPRKVLKGTDKVAKYRRSIYNMLTDEDSDLDLETGEGDVGHNYHGNSSYKKQR